MSEEKKENRINIEDLPQAEGELTTEDAKQVKGGLLTPAIQKVREIAPRSESLSLQDGTLIEHEAFKQS